MALGPLPKERINDIKDVISEHIKSDQPISAKDLKANSLQGYDRWVESVLDLYGDSIEEIAEELNIEESSNLHAYLSSDAGIDSLYKKVNKSAIEIIENVIGTTIEDFSSGTELENKSYAEQVSGIYDIISNPESEFYADLNKESVLDMFFTDKNIKKMYSGENGLQKFLDEFGSIYFSPEELSELDIDWAMIADKIEESILTQQENAYKQWLRGSNRFSEALSYDERIRYEI